VFSKKEQGKWLAIAPLLHRLTSRLGLESGWGGRKDGEVDLSLSVSLVSLLESWKWRVPHSTNSFPWKVEVVWVRSESGAGKGAMRRMRWQMCQEVWEYVGVLPQRVKGRRRIGGGILQDGVDRYVELTNHGRWRMAARRNMAL
jgi:hypothetical protein